MEKKKKKDKIEMMISALQETEEPQSEKINGDKQSFFGIMEYSFEQESMGTSPSAKT